MPPSSPPPGQGRLEGGGGEGIVHHEAHPRVVPNRPMATGSAMATTEVTFFSLHCFWILKIMIVFCRRQCVRGFLPPAVLADNLTAEKNVGI